MVAAYAFSIAMGFQKEVEVKIKRRECKWASIPRNSEFDQDIKTVFIQFILQIFL